MENRFLFVASLVLFLCPKDIQTICIAVDGSTYFYDSSYGRQRPKEYCVCTFSELRFNYVDNPWYHYLNNPLRCYGLQLKIIMPTMRANFFFENNNFREVFLNGTQLEIIEPGAFNNLAFLEELHLEKNNLKNISEGTFNSLSRLRVLFLDNNRINYINNNAFIGTKQLETLSLSYNNISVLDYAPFMPIFYLKRLNISNNPLQVVSKFYLNPTVLAIQSLGFLNISTVVHELCFSDNKNVTISTNILAIQQLDVSHNKISYLNNSVFENATALQFLNMSFNNLRELYTNTFVNSRNLSVLDLHHNEISTVYHGAFNGLLNLTRLDLSQNKIKALGYGYFESLHKLRALNLSTNMIAEFNYVRSKYQDDSLNLYLDNNRLSDLKMEVFVSVLEVSLYNNLWKCADLSELVAYLDNKKIKILLGTVHDSHNIHKIACDNSKFVTVNQPFLESSAGVINQLLEQNNQLFQKSSFVNFFRYDFENTAFYNFFKNYQAQIVNKNLLQMILNGTGVKNQTENFAFQEKLISEMKDNNNNNNNSGNGGVLSYFEVIALYGILICFVCLYVVLKKNKFNYNISDGESQIELRL